MITVNTIATIAEAKARKVMGVGRVFFTVTTTDDTLTVVAELSEVETLLNASHLLKVYYTAFDTLEGLAGEQVYLITSVEGVVTLTLIDTRQQNDLTTAALTVTTDATVVEINVLGVDGSTIVWNGYYELLTAINEPSI